MLFGRRSAEVLQQVFVLKALLHFLQREQEMRVGELGPRGAINMGGTGMIVKGLVDTKPDQVTMIT